MEWDPIQCGHCQRPIARADLTKHHCLPKAKGGTTEDIRLLCGMCHGMVHATYTNNTLASLYATIGELRQAPELQLFIGWVRRQSTTRRMRNEPRRRKL